MVKSKIGQDGDSEPSITLHTLALTTEQLLEIKRYCDYHLWEFFAVEHALFAFRHKAKKVVITGYKSGKLVVSGKGTADFVRDYLEPEITKKAALGYDEVHHPEWYETHAGLDEAGKGDLFGPVVTACVVAGGEAVREWQKAGVKDSKFLSDRTIKILDKKIRATAGVAAKTAWCGMARYNELMAKPKANLNLLLAWLHARSLQSALEVTSAPYGLLDQFSTSPLVQRQLKKDGIQFDLRMRTRAESDPVVAAASIVARAEFVRRIEELSEAAGETLLKGASAAVKEQARRLVVNHGPAALGQFAKLHFRTAREVLGLPVAPKVPWNKHRSSKTSRSAGPATDDD